MIAALLVPGHRCGGGFSAGIRVLSGKQVVVMVTREMHPDHAVACHLQKSLYFSSPWISCRIRFASMSTGSEMPPLSFKSSKFSKGLAFRDFKRLHILLFPIPGTSCSECSLVVIGRALLKKATNRASSCATMISMKLPRLS